MSSPLSTPGPCQSGAAHGAILLFLPLALMSALLNSSVPTPLYPHYQQMLALSDVSLTLIYGGYAAGVLISADALWENGCDATVCVLGLEPERTQRLAQLSELELFYLQR